MNRASLRPLWSQSTSAITRCLSRSSALRPKAARPASTIAGQAMFARLGLEATLTSSLRRPKWPSTCAVEDAATPSWRQGHAYTATCSFLRSPPRTSPAPEDKRRYLQCSSARCEGAVRHAHAARLPIRRPARRDALLDDPLRDADRTRSLHGTHRQAV